MSARQRHSRVTNSDGWTTISASHKHVKFQAKSKSKSKSSKSISKPHHQSGLPSALLAHKSDLDAFHAPNPEGIVSLLTAGKDGLAPQHPQLSTEEVETAKKRLEKQIATFNASSCCEGLKALIRRGLGLENLAKDTPDGEVPVKNVLILALGSISSSFVPAPGFQLAAALAVIEVLKEGLGSTSLKGVGGEDERSGGQPTEGGEVKEGEERDLEVISYDPVYKPLDINLLKSYNITPIPAFLIPPPPTSPSPDQPNPSEPSTPPSPQSWYRSSLIYMPHASIWLNHKYFLHRPKIWIGNSFEVYETAVMEREEGERCEVARALDEVKAVVEEEGYEALEWPEVEWGGGAVFNNTVVYVRRGRGKAGSSVGSTVEMELS
ncbi:hypothetical protein ABW19_dt0207113 [Dactylella cylindrospora]|nr:hypothetical protein ABW19_dt0207113 [Dactylella cylindrospora]